MAGVGCTWGPTFLTCHFVELMSTLNCSGSHVLPLSNPHSIDARARSSRVDWCGGCLYTLRMQGIGSNTFCHSRSSMVGI